MRPTPSLALAPLSVGISGESHVRRVHAPLRVDARGETLDDDALDAEIDGHVVRLLRRDTSAVERSFRFADRVLAAVLAFFPADDADDAGRSGAERERRRRRRSLQEPRAACREGYRPPRRPHLCVLARADCVHIFAPDGDEVFEVALPFHADRMLAARSGGLLLQRRSAAGLAPRASSAAFSPPVASASTLRTAPDRPTPRPRFFTLRHPLEEVKPLALVADPHSHFATRPSRDGPRFLSDPALQAVDVCGPLASADTEWLVCFHTDNRQFVVYALTAFVPEIHERRAPRAAPKTSFVSSQSPSLLLLSPTEHRRQEREKSKAQVAAPGAHLEPDKSARLLWTSPCVDALARTATAPAAASRVLPVEDPAAPSPLFAAFVVSEDGLDRGGEDMDDDSESHLLCLVDVATGVLVLKTMGERSQVWSVGEPAREIRTLRCRAAVPVALFSGTNRRRVERMDAVVATADGQLVLLCGGTEVATLVCPRNASPPSPSSVRLEPAAAGTLAIVGPQGVVWRCPHPLRLPASSSAVALIWDALAFGIPSETYLRLRLATLLFSSQRMPPSSAPPISDRWMAVFAMVVIQAISASFPSPSSAESSPPRDSKKPRNSLQATPDLHPALAAMNASPFARIYQHEHAMVLAPLDSVLDTHDPGILNAAPAPLLASRHVPRLSTATLQTLVTVLHLVHEELRLSLAHRAAGKELGALLGHVSARLGLSRLEAYYHRQQVVLHWPVEPSERVCDTLVATLTELDRHLASLDIFHSLQSLLQLDLRANEEDDEDDDTMMMSSSSWSLPPSDAWDDCSLITRRRSDRPSPFWRLIALRQVFQVLFALRSAVVQRDWALELLAFLTSDPLGIALDLRDLPVGLRIPLLDALRVIREAPPPGITSDMSRFVGRLDLDNEGSTEAASSCRPEGLQELRPVEAAATTDETTHRPPSDGLAEMQATCQRLFPHDQRLKEVARLLRSSRPLCLKLEKTADMSDQDFVAQQQARLLLLCKRSMALSVARGMVTLGTLDASAVETHAWHLSVPALPLAGRTPPTNAVVALDVSGYAKELTHWPQFHNGCATALRLPTRNAAAALVTRYWIKYHRPSARDFAAASVNANPSASASATTTARPHSLHQSARDLEEAQAAHAGLLLGLGLKGHLRCLSMADVYNYLSLSNEFITVAILLGMAATAAHSRRRRQQRLAQVLRRRRPTTSASTGSQASSQSTVHGNDDDDDAMIAPSQDDPPGATDDLEIESSQPAPTEPEPATEDNPTKSTAGGLELSLERSVSKMLCLHIPSLLPAPFAEFSVPATTQTAALLGLGILYQATGHRLMTELLLAEITRAPSTVQYGSSHTGTTGVAPTGTPFDQLEGYSLAAGLALGLVVLGRGRSTGGDPGLADLMLEDRLCKYIVGGAQAPSPTPVGTGAGSCLYRGRQWRPLGSGRSSVLSGGDGRPSSDEAKVHGSAAGEQVNIGVTASGSALALAFMYLKSGNRSIASLLQVPDTLRLLDYVRPDLLLLRTLAKNLVLWDAMEPSVAWVETTEMPAQLRETYRLVRENASTLPDDIDVRGVCEAYANIVAGACFGLGLRFAGTSNGDARDTLRHFVRQFRDMRSASSLLGGDIIAAATERATIERSLAVCAQALALVDAGTGNVETLTLLRSINLRQRAEAELTYGNHMALSMAIGLLFLGGGRATVSRSSDAIAMLVVALYPMAAMNTADNKYYLQAFRHLYSLAVDSSRLVEIVDASTHENCSVTIKLAMYREPQSLDEAPISWQTLQTPCLLPDLATIDRIVIEDPAFYPVEIRLDGYASDRRHLYRLQHPVFPFDSSSELRQLKFLDEYYRLDPFRLWDLAV
ncbi:hypothetical protein P43SY_009382 [Pythium insidiosum]|uniref:Anaphase-promoting complex subunit 1 N-terminal domain-containing protein n=1 Tax=Pythium insidiosum TaxID=114742 RepID=A0AAD5LHX4_PYTIN|nr:hypothetical protein P43SY_009382 [Pythium insidiosum]